MHGSKNALFYAFLSIALFACATAPPPVPGGVVCETRDFAIVDDFGGARRGQCEILSDTSARITIVPEDAGVTNPSPWYAFKLMPGSPTTAIIQIDYVGEKHRYPPKISDDGSTWRPLGSRHIETSKDKSSVLLSIAIDDIPLWVAAQEVLVNADYAQWYEALSADPQVEVLEIGRSVKARPVISISHDTDAPEAVLLVGRQHPPEVSGAIAMQVFVDTVLADTPLAREFRERFRMIAIPLLNPDGVAEGHWRHNAGGVDLNRDWGPFTQPETAAIAGLLDELDSRGTALRLFLDFHSTKRNLFYTQMPGDATNPPGFARAWLGRAGERIGDYEFAHEPRPVSAAANGKQYMFRRYGIPSMTYEVGDETDRRSVRSSAAVFAEEMMRELLGQ